MSPPYSILKVRLFELLSTFMYKITQEKLSDFDYEEDWALVYDEYTVKTTCTVKVLCAELGAVIIIFM